ncbi:MAG: HAD family hydrolase, partial [Halobacteria archaeon]|nr:HAD family hydrolase [Halobacteria archaeon]
AFLGYGHPDIDKMRGVCAKYDLDLEEVWRTRERRSAEIQRDLIREGKRSLYDDFDAVRDMKDRKLGIVSNNQHETVGYVTDHFGIDSLFGTYYGREPTVEGIRRS